MTEGSQRRIYMLSPKQISPETIAVTFAKTSRSPQSFDEIALELSDEASAQFHEKWVIGYGHASIAEHAVLHIAFENVSRLAIECLESNRLASYTEKSTRYQHWEPGSYHLPDEVVDTPYESLYKQTCDSLFQAYLASLEPARKVVMEKHPRRDGEDDEQWDRRIRSRYVDACRFLLPAAALANVGMTANARVLENAIRKMLSHPLEEVRAIGMVVKEAARREVPTLVKYADAVPYRIESETLLGKLARSLPLEVGTSGVTLVSHDPDGEDNILAAALYSRAQCEFKAAFQHVQELDQGGRRDLADALLGKMEKFDTPLRALEHAWYSFDIVLDQGAYFELKRHRMMTQTAQPLTTELGFSIPQLIVEAGYEQPYHEALEAAREAYRSLSSWNADVAAYLVPNGYNRRVLCTLNLREIFHLCELRSQPNAHFSIRRIALQMAEQVQQIHPVLGSYLRLPDGADWRKIEEAYFSQV